MSRSLGTAALLCLTLAISSARADESSAELGIRVPEGFRVSLFADDTLAHDIYTMTLDSQGRVVVSGPGYVKTLHDDNQDGQADRATLFSTLPKHGAHGMIFDGPDLIYSGDNGIHRLRDRDGDGTADGPPEQWSDLKNPEHGANGLVRGPDGCFYLVCGNDAGVGPEQAVLPSSPVKHPRCGAIVRFSASGQPLDVYAHGFRNPYDLDIDAAGHVLTIDSDGERDHHLPWYAPTRLFDVAQGQEHGWLLKGWTQSWNRPESFFDNVPRIANVGRGSPTGVAVYRHRQFPQHYRGGVFTACWTFGRVYYFPLTPQGASVVAAPETFVETTGDTGFAPCDLAVGSQGELYVAIGGRRTRGSVFRVTYERNDPAKNETASTDPLDRVLSADQPLASWSRARWVPLAKELGQSALAGAAKDEQRASGERARALEILVELCGGISPDLATQCVTSPDAAVRSRLAWALGRSSASPASTQQIAHLTGDVDPAVERAAWEALAAATVIDPLWNTQPDWALGLSSSDRRVRSAAIAVARGVGHSSYQDFASRVRIRDDAILLRLAMLRIELPESQGSAQAPILSTEQLAVCGQILADSQAALLARLEAVRLLQLGLGDMRQANDQTEVYAGYAAPESEGLSQPERAALIQQVASAFPSGDDELDRELARLLGMLQAEHEGLLTAIANKWTPTSSVEDDLHYLIVASRLPGSRPETFTEATANALLGLHAKLAAAGDFPSRNWPFRVVEVFAELSRWDSALPEAIATHPGLNQVGHALLVEQLPSALRPAATRSLWTAALAGQQSPTAELVALASQLPPEECRALLRPLWEDGHLRDAVVLGLAPHPVPEDRAKYIEGLSSPQTQVVQAASRALVTLGIRCTPAEMAVALRALKQACTLGEQMEPRITLMRLLEFWTEDNADVEWDPDPARLWVGWYQLFADYYPAEAAKLSATSGTDSQSWLRRLESIDWTAGEALAGRKVFELQSCHRCHQESGHLGPELKGAVTRMSRADLFTAVVDPNLEVSPAYHTTLIASSDGQVYHGLVVYESPESTLLQTGPDTTVRITNTETESMRTSKRSLMPAGLLDTLSDRNLSDLYAYLKSLVTD